MARAFGDDALACSIITDLVTGDPDADFLDRYEMFLERHRIVRELTAECASG